MRFERCLFDMLELTVKRGKDLRLSWEAPETDGTRSLVLLVLYLSIPLNLSVLPNWVPGWGQDW